MTEMSPLGTVGALQSQYANLKGDPKLDVLQMQGYPHSRFKDTGDCTTTA
jgi:fatty-acyl-CoA synthase